MANVENKDLKKETKKRFVKALYSYVPVNIDELSLKVHDILEVVEETEEGWWKGILDGNVGMFPSNFVIELDGHPEEFNNKLMNELSPTKNSSKGKNVGEQEPMIRQGNSLLQTNKENSKQSILSAGNGNEIDGSSSSKSSHEILDKKILTPSKKPSTDSSAPRLPPKPVREQARVLFPYEAQNEDELSLKEGDTIIVISKEVEDKGWWKGELNNKVGVFPDNFVKLIKTEEQKKPERPDKPATVISSKINLKSGTSDKSNSESSPKVDKKLIKTPPAKPPPPELHKKDSERPLPPCPSKKPQPPHPVKKPARVSVGARVAGIINAPVPISNLKSPISEASPPLPTYPPISSTEKVEDKKQQSDSTIDKKDNESKKAQPEFDAVEPSSKKLVHLTANRAKAPNRRPPSFIFLKENEKDACVTLTDSRRRSEPLLAEMESILSSNTDLVKTSAISSLEKKPKVPPPRPFLPSTVKMSSTIKSGTTPLVKRNSLDESSLKQVEVDKKDLLSEVIPPSVALTLKNEINPQKIPEPPCEPLIKPVHSEKESSSSKEESCVQNNNFVTRKDFNELLRQVKELKVTLEAFKSNSSKAINDLKVELEGERKLRHNMEIELQTLKDSQTT